MKHFLLGLASIVIVAGCQTVTKDPQPEKYRVQVIEIEVPSDLADEFWPEQVWALDPVHFQRETIKNDSSQYISVKPLTNGIQQAMQANEIDHQTMYTDAQVISASIEKMMQILEAKITEFPEIFLSVGEQIIDDQTERTEELPVDYEVVEGKTVVTMKDSFRFGRSIDIQLIEADNSMATFNLKLFIGRLKGFDTYTLSNGDEINMPLAEYSNSNTQYTQPTGSWNIIGGWVHEQTENGKTNKTSHILCIRVMSPTSTNQKLY